MARLEALNSGLCSNVEADLVFSGMSLTETEQDSELVDGEAPGLE